MKFTKLPCKYGGKQGGEKNQKGGNESIIATEEEWEYLMKR